MVGCGGAGLLRAESGVSLGADGAGGAGSTVTVSEGAAGQPGGQVRLGGRAAAGRHGVGAAGGDMGRAGRALGCPEAIPACRGLRRRRGRAEGHRGAGRSTAGAGLRKARGQAGRGQSRGRAGRAPLSAPAPDAWLPAGPLGSSQAMVTAGRPPALPGAWLVRFFSCRGKACQESCAFTRGRSRLGNFGYCCTSCVKFVLQKLSPYPLNAVG